MMKCVDGTNDGTIREQRVYTEQLAQTSTPERGSESIP